MKVSKNFILATSFDPDGSMIYTTAAEYVTSTGKIRDGQRYLVYHFLICNDRFYPLPKKGSVDGCYIPFRVIPVRERPLTWMYPSSVGEIFRSLFPLSDVFDG